MEEISPSDSTDFYNLLSSTIQCLHFLRIRKQCKMLRTMRSSFAHITNYKHCYLRTETSSMFSLFNNAYDQKMLVLSTFPVSFSCPSWTHKHKKIEKRLCNFISNGKAPKAHDFTFRIVREMTQRSSVNRDVQSLKTIYDATFTSIFPTLVSRRRPFLADPVIMIEQFLWSMQHRKLQPEMILYPILRPQSIVTLVAVAIRTDNAGQRSIPKILICKRQSEVLIDRC